METIKYLKLLWFQHYKILLPLRKMKQSFKTFANNKKIKPLGTSCYLVLATYWLTHGLHLLSKFPRQLAGSFHESKITLAQTQAVILVNKVARRQVSLPVLGISPVSITQPLLHTRTSLICHRRFTTLVKAEIAQSARAGLRYRDSVPG